MCSDHEGLDFALVVPNVHLQDSLYPGGGVILALSSIEKLTEVSTVVWTASPLLLFWLLDTRLASELRHHAELLKKNPAKDDRSVIYWEVGDIGLFPFFKELISLSGWPFYLILFSLVGFGARDITKTNKEAAEAAQKVAAVTPDPVYYQQGSLPQFPNRAPVNQISNKRFTPTPFSTPARFPSTIKPFATLPKTVVTPSLTPSSSPASATKSPQ